MAEGDTWLNVIKRVLQEEGSWLTRHEIAWCAASQSNAHSAGCRWHSPANPQQSVFMEITAQFAVRAQLLRSPARETYERALLHCFH